MGLRAALDRWGKISPPTGFDPRTVQLIGSLYTDYATRPTEWPRGFYEVKFPRFHDTAQDGGKFVSLTHRPPLPPGNTPGTHFC